MKNRKNSLLMSALPKLSNKIAALRLLSVSLLIGIFAAGVALLPTSFIHVSSSSVPQGKASPDDIWQVIDPASLGGNKESRWLGTTFLPSISIEHISADTFASTGAYGVY